jgi:hypothetical protein
VPGRLRHRTTGDGQLSVISSHVTTLTVLTPLGGRIAVGSPIDPYSGAIFEGDKNDGVETVSSHTENVYFPEGYPGGKYYFYVDMLAEKSLNLAKQHSFLKQAADIRNFSTMLLPSATLTTTSAKMTFALRIAV